MLARRRHRWPPFNSRDIGRSRWHTRLKATPVSCASERGARGRFWPMTAATASGRGVRLQGVNLPVARAPSSIPIQRTTGRGASRSMPAACRAPRRAPPPRHDRCRWRDRPRGPPMPPRWRAAGAKIKPGEPGEALCRAIPPRQDRCRWRDRSRGPRCRRGGERRPDQARRSVARPSTRHAAAPGPMPVAHSAARPSMPPRWRAAPASRLAIGREALAAPGPMPVARSAARPSTLPCHCARADAGGGARPPGPRHAVPLRQD